MKLKLNPALLLIYLAILSIILGKILFVPIILASLLFLLGRYIHSEFENMIMAAIALLPFTPLFAIFIFYLPFAVYGYFLGPGFARRYIFGYALSFFSAILVYILSELDVKINVGLIITSFYLPVLIVALRLYWKNKAFGVFREIYRIEAREFAVILISLLFLSFVTHNIMNNDNLYMSNGTYVYTKFFSVADGIKKSGQVPQYEPRIAQGEHLFYTDTAVFYSNLGPVSLALGWIPPVLFFNSITVFIMWLSILALWLFIRELLPEKNGYISFILPIAASMSVVLSFMFLQLFESFKQSSAYPINFLVLALIFSFPKSPKVLLSILALLILSFLIHGTQFIGFGQLAILSFLMLMLLHDPGEKLGEAIGYFRRSKLKAAGIIFLVILIAAIPQFYSVPGQIYKGYMRVPFSLKSESGFSQIKITLPDYLFKGLFLDKNTNPISLKYPDLRRIDDKKFGFFFSFFGILCLLLVLINFKKNAFRKTAAFSFAYLLHFLFSSLLVVITFFNSIEYGYRTVLPFMLVLFLACIAAVICSIPSRTIKIALIAALFAAFIHASFYAGQNLTNIHAESIISGQNFRNEKELVKQIPIDGRFITYGMYSNAVDMAMSSVTGRYFSRYGFLQWDFGEDSLYMKVHGLNSFGEIERVEQLSGNELANYLRLGGYKYVFLNACSPVGYAVLNKLLPSNAFPIYQNPDYKCHVFLGVNNTYYAEKVDIVEEIDEERYNNPDGYKYISISDNKKLYNFDKNKYNAFGVEGPKIPKPLEFERPNFNIVKIRGNFEKDGWVVFKEEYFPRWKAYMNGKEVPLLATNYRMMLIKTDEGSLITLEYSLQPKEKFAAVLSLIAIAILFIFFVIAV